MKMILVTDQPLDTQKLRGAWASHPCCGADLIFEGRVRNESRGRGVQGVTYECYQAMAEKELAVIVEETKQQWPVHQVGVAHRFGFLKVGEVSLVVIITSPHRAEGFEALQYVISELKQRVPIWKKEFYADGKSEWTSGSRAHGGDFSRRAEPPVRR